MDQDIGRSRTQVRPPSSWATAPEARPVAHVADRVVRSCIRLGYPYVRGAQAHVARFVGWNDVLDKAGIIRQPRGMDEDTRTQASRALLDAQRSRQQIRPLSERYPDIDVDDAYEIQLIGVRTEQESGRLVKGHKVGLTSKAMQSMLGVHEPDYGHLFDDMFFPEGSSVSMDLFLQPRVEIEVAFVLGERLAGPGITVADVLRATSFVCPSIEIIDSRIDDWRITLVDTIADNGSSAGVVLGGRRTSLDGLDLRTIGTTLRRNGSIVETGASGAVLGNPANAVAWLANKVAAFGVALEPGHVVLPGACTRAVNVEGGDVFRADFDGLGYVSIAFPVEVTQ